MRITWRAHLFSIHIEWVSFWLRVDATSWHGECLCNYWDFQRCFRFQVGSCLGISSSRGIETMTRIVSMPYTFIILQFSAVSTGFSLSHRYHGFRFVLPPSKVNCSKINKDQLRLATAAAAYRTHQWNHTKELHTVFGWRYRRMLLKSMWESERMGILCIWHCSSCHIMPKSGSLLKFICFVLAKCFWFVCDFRISPLKNSDWSGLHANCRQYLSKNQPVKARAAR